MLVLECSGDNADVPATQATICNKRSLPPLQGNANVEDEQQTVAPLAVVANVWLYPSSTGSSGVWEPSDNDSGGMNILLVDGIFSELESHLANNSNSKFEEV